MFKCQTLQSSWFPAHAPDWHYTTFGNGWTSNQTGPQWLRDVFVGIDSIKAQEATASATVAKETKTKSDEALKLASEQAAMEDRGCDV